MPIVKLMRDNIYRGILLFLVVSFLHGEIVHQIQKGDTLYSISKKYGVSVEDIQQFNAINDPSELLSGKTLKIPHLYKVREGDTLYSIAQKLSSSVEMIRMLNNLNGEKIVKGSTLLVPDSRVSFLGSQKNTNISRNRHRSTSNQNKRFTWPVSGTHTPLKGKLPGIAISAKESKVVAVRAGRVIYVGPHSSFKHVILIQSSRGYVYVYAGQDYSHVQIGEYVKAGTVIGKLTSDERDHTLYFSVWKNNNFVNPSQAPRG